MKKISIPWCDEERSFFIDEENLIWTATPKYIKGTADEEAEIIRAIRNPIGTKKLKELIKNPNTATVAIVVDDNTRVTPAQKILKPLIDILRKIGVLYENIKVIFALGSHRPMTETEMRQKIGDWCFEHVKTENHEYDNDEKLVRLGKTSYNTQVIINKTFYNSDFKICIGNIIPQFIAGWSGGAKIIQPGISGKDTTAAVHLKGSLDWPDRLGNAENNIRLDMEEIARIAGLDFIINTVLNLENEIVKVFCGDLVKAHRAGVEWAKKIYQMEIPQKADIVVAGTYPANRDLWQADKALAAAVLMVKKGKTVIWCAPAKDGISPEHPILLQLGDKAPKEVYDMCMRDEIKDKVGASAHIMIGVMRSMANVILVSDGVKEEDALKLGFSYADSIEGAIEKAIKREGKLAKIGILTHGADFAPVVKRKD